MGILNILRGRAIKLSSDFITKDDFKDAYNNFRHKIAEAASHAKKLKIAEKNLIAYIRAGNPIALEDPENTATKLLNQIKTHDDQIRKLDRESMMGISKVCRNATIVPPKTKRSKTSLPGKEKKTYNNMEKFKMLMMARLPLQWRNFQKTTKARSNNLKSIITNLDQMKSGKKGVRAVTITDKYKDILKVAPLPDGITPSDLKKAYKNFKHCTKKAESHAKKIKIAEDKLIKYIQSANPIALEDPENTATKLLNQIKTHDNQIRKLNLAAMEGIHKICPLPPPGEKNNTMGNFSIKLEIYFPSKMINFEKAKKSRLNSLERVITNLDQVRTKTVKPETITNKYQDILETLEENRPTPPPTEEQEQTSTIKPN